MKIPQIPKNEQERLDSLKSYHILDTLPEQAFDDIASIAAYICQTPIALITLIDEKRQWFKSRRGLEIGGSETPREVAFCAHAINEPSRIMEVPDASRDERFLGNPLLEIKPSLRFYAGAPLVNSKGHALGTICVIDHRPRKLNEQQKKVLQALSRQVMAQLESRKNERKLLFAQFSFEHGSEGMAWINEQARVIHFNDRYAEIIGFSRRELSTKRVFEFDPNFTEESWREHWREMNEKKTMTLESLVMSIDGKIRPIELRLKIMEYAGQRYIHAICMDITDRKKAEISLKQSEANLLALVENSADTIWSLDGEYRYITFNTIFKEYISRLIGRELMPGDYIDFSTFEPEVTQYWKKLYKRAFSGERFIEESHMVLNNKNIALENSFNPIVDEHKNVIGVSVFSRNVTEKYEERQRKKRFQEGLQLLNDLASNSHMSFGELMKRSLRVIGEFLGMPLGVMSNIVGQQYEVIAYYTTDPFIQFEEGQFFDLGGTYCDLTYRQNGVVAINDMKNSEHSAHSCYKAFKLESYIGAIIKVDNERYGTVNFCDSKPRKIPFDSYDKEFLQLFANWIGSEIERRQNSEKLRLAKENAEAASIAKENFLSTMSHEIRTPLNAIIGMTQLLIHGNPTEEQKENLDLIKFSGENLLVLINDILDYNKIAANKLIIDEQNFNLRSLLESIKGAHLFKVREKGIKFELHVDETLPKVLKGDSVRITQIINNLVGNAIKFTEKGSVRVLAAVKKVKGLQVVLHIAVEDSGIGIRKDKIETIFDQFVQAESSTTRKYGGTGLGLSITKKLLAMMGSEICVESEPGKGTRFYFNLTLSKGDEKKMLLTRNNKSSIQDISAYHIRVLVVEDNEANRLVIHKFLKNWGIETTFANDGTVALEKIKKPVYNLILMDLQMPRMDGYTATKMIRNMPGNYYREIPILALTASVMNNVKEKVFACGMNDYLTKPFDPLDLYNKLITHLNIDLPARTGGVKKKRRKETVASGKYRLMLDQFANNDPVFRKELLRSYLDNVSQLKAVFPIAVGEKDLEKARKIAHKVKFTLHTLQEKEIGELIEQGKKLAAGKQDGNTLKNFVSVFGACCDRLSGELKALLELEDKMLK